MQMDEGLDTGDMLLKKRCPIVVDDTAQTLHDKLAPLGGEAIIEALQHLEQGRLSPERQDAAQATYAAKLTKAEAQLDWTAAAEQLDRAVRAYLPFPVATSLLHGTPIKIHRARQRVDAGDSLPGTVISIDKDCVIVSCGRGSLGLEVLQKPGGKALPVQQFLQGFPVKVGDRFGGD